MTAAWTLAALVAFAGNSLLCRLALGAGLIDAASFTTIRIASGAMLLVAIANTRARGRGSRAPGWLSAFVLFVYAIPFSYAYLSLPAGTGALLLFGAVQTTMLATAILSGERPGPLEWLGLAGATAGLVYLVSPGLSAPPPGGAALMLVAGVCWGFYSLLGRRATDPLAETATNFVRCLPLVALVSAVTIRNAHVSVNGALLAAVSGAVTSGLGYVAWYTALPRLTATRAATVQLAVPVIAAAGGVAAMGEEVTVRLVTAAVLVLGGIGLATFVRRRPVLQSR
ncbi:MAG: DMT family transporter [Vicinamibacterales bacterium]